MHQAIERLLNDQALLKKMQQNATAIQQADGIAVATKVIEKVGFAHKLN
jgi:UDP:flavonoid glycosyltransferase YjiC (YdhE family)